jgi:transcription antitermination protein NusB
MAIRAETRARALALQLLYAWDQAADGAGDPGALWARAVPLVAATPAVRARALAMAAATVRDVARLDAALAAATERWRLERLAVVDRNLLRLAVAELDAGATPPRVVIDEAVRLARWFGGPRSPAFVNGILDRVARDHGRL